MDKIDDLTNSLNKYSIQKNVTPDNQKRYKGQENEDEKTLILKDEGLYTIKLDKQPKNIIGGTMREYQLEGLNWLLKMNNCNINGILADEMGLGKTLQTISMIAQLSLEGEKAPSIVIVPKSTLSNWVKEFKKWCPSLEIFEFYAAQGERELLRPRIPRTDSYKALLTTYETVLMEKGLLKTVKWNYLIIDEAHRIKNEKSVLSQVVRLFTARHRLLITGTPLQNNLQELWALLNFLMPLIFGSSTDFNEWFDLTNSQLSDQNYIIIQLHKILKPFMLRRLKREVETKLPPKKELYVFLSMTDLQKDLYRKILTKNIEVINGFGEKSQLINTIMQLRKTCNHPYLFEGIEPGPPFLDGDHLIKASMKFKFLDQLIPKLIEKSSKLLIFTQMTRLLDILDDFLSYRGYKFCRIDGNTHYIERENQIERFQKEGSDVMIFILSTRAGGLGINLHAANTVIIYDSDWNPQVDIQAQDRAHRIGQIKPVTVYRFVIEGTVEEKIAERAAKKLKMDHLVIQKGSLANSTKAPTLHEMNSIVQFGAQQVLKSTGKDILEEDINKVLMYSEEKTKEINQELSKLEEAFNLNNMSFDGNSFYDFEGSNYKTKQKEHISLGARNRRSTGFYEVDRSSNYQKKQKKKGWRAIIGGGYLYQFFPSEELDALDLKEEKWIQYLNEKSRRRTRGQEKDLKPEKFTDEDEEKRDELLDQGFSEWSKREFNNFIKGCESFGRTNFIQIAQVIETKTIEEVEIYAKVFWERVDSLPNGNELCDRINKGEKDLARITRLNNVLESKRKRVNEGDSVFMCIQDGSKFVKDEDAFLTKNLLENGYGQWDKLRVKFKTVDEFRFNFWMQTRTAEELQDRSDRIIEAMEKEQMEIDFDNEYTSVLGGPNKIRKIKENEEGRIMVEVTDDFQWVITFPKFSLS
ncbi:hypothetical protein SteCoe_29829 [Stentor coeruleus]|uniref:Uncharacterized protein n=1 Tax=Stentor coeruleus TaxID=5963 RepID=A0A1R2B522_9CILI|nr:hypothetical protein SteCoe_29829 [Stentor coeruleus]